MRLNRRVPVGTHGGVRGRFSYLFRGASYSIILISSSKKCEFDILIHKRRKPVEEISTFTS